MHFNQHPIRAHAFPASPVAAVHLAQRPHAEGRTLWIDMAFLSFLSSLRQHSARAAIDSFVRAVMDHHAAVHTSCTIPRDSLQKSVGKALEEYDASCHRSEQLVAKVSRHKIAPDEMP